MNSLRFLIGAVSTLASGVSFSASVCHAQVCTTARVSHDSTGAQALARSLNPSISADGRFVSFSTSAPLVPQDVNVTISDLYAVDVDTGAVELLSVSITGGAGNADTRWNGDFSADGRFVSFTSLASNLVPGLSSPSYRAFVRDRLLGQTRLVSGSSTGNTVDSYGPTAISGDGRFVAFWTSARLDPVLDQNDLADIYVRDLQTGTAELITVNALGQGGVGTPGFLFNSIDLSADGRFVVFNTWLSDLVVGDTNGTHDAFLRDRTNALTTLVSLSSGGQQGNSESGDAQCSEDGRFIVFTSSATNLVAGDTNMTADVFVRDTVAGTTAIASINSSGLQSDGWSHFAAISPDGRFIGFKSQATNLVPGDTNATDDVFVHDRVSGWTERISVDSAGAQATNYSYYPALARDAGRIAFISLAALEAGDTNNLEDIYVHDCPLPISYCTAKTNSLGCVPRITASGMPLATWPNGYVLSARDVLNQVRGLFLYSTNGAAASPFHAGTLCVQQPATRTPVQNSGGSTTGSDCTGTFAFDFNTRIASGVDPALVAGAQVWAQYWSRDPGFAPPDDVSLTDAMTFIIQP